MEEILKVNNLKKKYGKTEVLKDLSLTINAKEIVALIGVNGSGKSTLIEIICGVKNKNSGEISIFNTGMTNYKSRMAIKKQLGYMPQHFCLFNDLTVKENLQYMSSVYELKDKNEVDRVIEKCFLTDKKNYMTKNLSGGYKQLLSLAAAIIHSPKFLILDEPTSAMDPLFRQRFWEIIKGYNENFKGTVLVTTHYMEEIFKCNKILFLSKGKVIHSNLVSNIFENGKFKSIDEVLSYYILKEEKNGQN